MGKGCRMALCNPMSLGSPLGILTTTAHMWGAGLGLWYQARSPEVPALELPGEEGLDVRVSIPRLTPPLS